MGCIVPGFAQLLPEDAPPSWVNSLNLTGGLPEKLLATRSVVFYSFMLSAKELEDSQKSFAQTGIDAIVYFELDMLKGGKDITRAFSDYLTKREIANVILLEKNETGFRLSITEFNGKEDVVSPQQSAWSVSNRVLPEVLRSLYRVAANQQKKLNLLINDQPEMNLPINPILGKRNEFFAIDLKVDQLAVPKFGDEQMDKALEQIMKDNYPLKYKLTEPGLTEKELRKQGLLYVLCFVNTRAEVARRLMGYDMSKDETSYESVTFPQPGQKDQKTIAANAPIYKFYFKHIDSGNVFLGTKWDADMTWQEALLNHIRGLKAELRLP